MTRTIKKITGFTLIEVMITSAIMAIVIGAAYLIWQTVIKNYSFTMNQYELVEDVNYAVLKIETELRQTQEAMQGAYPLATLEDYQIAFYADVDGDGLVEKVRYFLDNENLMRGVIDPSGNPPQYFQDQEKTSLIVQHVSNSAGPLFTYYNGNWPQSSVNNPLPIDLRLLETRLVKIFIPITIQDSQGTSTHSAEGTVHLRNLKNDL